MKRQLLHYQPTRDCALSCHSMDSHFRCVIASLLEGLSVRLVSPSLGLLVNELLQNGIFGLHLSKITSGEWNEAIRKMIHRPVGKQITRTHLTPELFPQLEVEWWGGVGYFTPSPI